MADCNVTFESIFKRSSYLNILLSPIFSVVAACFVVTVTLTLIRLVVWKKDWNFAKKFREADRKMIAYMMESFFNMLHHREGIRELESNPKEADIKFFGGAEEVKIHKRGAMTAEQVDDTVSHSSMIDTEEILGSKWAMTILSWYVASVSSLALVVFWDVFVLNNTTGCVDEDGIDCFYKNGTYINQFCSCLSYEEQVEATCYEIKLEFPVAIAEVAGILFLAFNGFTFLMFLKLLIADGVGYRSLKSLAYFVLAVFEYAAVFGIIGSFIARKVLLEKEDSTNAIIEQVLISAALMIGITTPWCLLFWALHQVRRRTNISEPARGTKETARPVSGRKEKSKPASGTQEISSSKNEVLY